ncbi:MULTISPECIES: MATE family efflux transporter [unclassified Bacillus (in: firmicutes)]|uniref:MATE family efflux transporter n=1 Tax=unclassified Bacillus (in: firmicutes) TaxID=185979 RepID=UPI00040A6954|nr:MULTISPECIES: MATE family efflux transporter [unclassified Bacillus (in: firmicutes)]QHZ47537.1 MATE family efflux transporter [Bacillus sp. NSP9.1]WFA03595.1 MATE family efflux transporter [Bacillus sp. HSf4]
MNHRHYLAVAVPLIISTITTPLLGAVDTAVAGQLSSPAYIGGVAVGTMIFNTMYWLLGFLRVSTSGFAAQSLGAQNRSESVLALARPVCIAFFAGLMFILLQKPLEYTALIMIQPDQHTAEFASQYFSLRIWGAPFALMSYCILGWLMGMSLIKVTLLLQVSMNILNIALDIVFVYVFHMEVNGIAAATLISELTGCLIGCWLVKRNAAISFKLPPVKLLFDPKPFKKMMIVNRDLLIRTLCLLTVFNLFTAKGADFGAEILAANAILIQIHYMMAYVFDGFANASSIFTGKAVGRMDRELYARTLSLSTQWALISAVLLSAGYFLLKDAIIPLFTPLESVLEAAKTYDVWIVLFPLAASFGLIFYGIFIGATEIGPVRNSIALAALVFLAAFFTAVPVFGNHGLWLSFLLFSFGRSLFLCMAVPGLTGRIFGKRELHEMKAEAES